MSKLFRASKGERHMALNREIGSATDPDTNEVVFTFCNNEADGSMFITHRPTGNVFTWGWSDMIDAALEAGIDEGPSEKEEQ